jgi:Na+/melibiose symporter-like transporter
VANATQNPHALVGIKALVAYYPTGGMLACLGLAVFYPLTESKMTHIHANMSQRSADEVTHGGGTESIAIP